MSDSRAPYLPPQRPYPSRRVFVMRGKKAFYLRVSGWGGLDSNQRPADYEFDREDSLTRRNAGM